MAVGSNSNVIAVKVKKKPKVFVNQSGMVTPGMVAQRLNDLADVDIAAKEDGSLLIYDEAQEKFISSRLLDKQEIDGGHF